MLAGFGAEYKPEKYSSYKGRFFNKYKEKARKLINGVDSLSLKKEDKLKLKKQMVEILNEGLRPKAIQP